MKIHKHGKHIKTINTVIESCLIVILIVLVAIMMVLIGKLQGTARVINYTGLVRGATQREVKLEITGNPNDELINYLDGILEDLKYKDGDYNLIKLDNNDYEKKLDTQIAFWILLKDEIYKVREYGYENTDIVNLSEEYFQLADQTVSAAEKYSERIACNIRLFEIFTAIDMIIIIIFIINHIVDELNSNQTLLTFISKNLSWGIFKEALTTKVASDDINFKDVYYEMINAEDISLEEPEKMLFLIVELVSSTCYSAILYKEPADIDTIKPYLFKTVRAIIKEHTIR